MRFMEMKKLFFLWKGILWLASSPKYRERQGTVLCLTPERHLDPRKRVAAGSWQLPPGTCPVHHDCRDPVWKTVFQDREAGSAPIRSSCSKNPCYVN